MQDLVIVHLLRNADDRFLALLQSRSQGRGAVSLLLEHKCRQKGDDLLWLVFGKDVLKNQLCQDQFIGRMDFAGHLALQLYSGLVIDKPEIPQDLNTLLIVRKQLEILIRHQLLQLRDVLLHLPLIMLHFKLGVKKTRLA